MPTVTSANRDKFNRAELAKRSGPEYDVGWKAGDKAKFSGTSADGNVSGDLGVSIVNPHVNASEVDRVDKHGTPFNKEGQRHLPRAQVELNREKRHLPNLQFEAFHHTLKKP